MEGIRRYQGGHDHRSAYSHQPLCALALPTGRRRMVPETACLLSAVHLPPCHAAVKNLEERSEASRARTPLPLDPSKRTPLGDHLPKPA